MLQWFAGQPLELKSKSGSAGLNFISAALARLLVCLDCRVRLWRWARAIWAAFCLGLLASVAYAQTQTGGAITANTIWQAAQSPYVVTSDIQIQNGATLEVEAGTTIYMQANTRMIIQSGALKAIGTAQSPIVFTSQKKQAGQAPAPGDWQQLIFNSGTGAATRLEHVQVEYGKGIVVNGAAPVFNNVIAKNNQGAAITVDLAASPSGTNNQAIGNAINAVVVPEGDIAGTVTWGIRGIPYLVLSGAVSVGASPKIDTVSPTTIQQGETQTVTLTGSRLSGLSQPLFTSSGVTAQVLSGGTASQIQLQVTADANAMLGAAGLVAVADAGEAKLANALTVLSTQPKLASIEPSSISTNQGDVLVTLKGQNFVNNSIAYLDTTALETTFVSATELKAVVPNQVINGSKTIKLRTPNQNSGGAEYVSNELSISIVTPPPVITGISPDSIRRGETRNFEITGTGLTGIQLAASDPALTISNLVLTSTKATFTLAATASATLGKRLMSLTSAGGSTSINVTVNPALPVASVAPTPLAVPPDGSMRQFAVQLSFADTESHTFTAAVGDATIATTPVSTVTIAAGQTQAIGSIKGIKAGVTSLTLTSAAFAPISVPIYVTSDFVGLNTSTAPLLGVVLTPPSSPPPQQSVSPVSPNLGVVMGNVIQNMSPKAFSIGGTGTLTITGVGLQDAAAVSFKPADGITVGSVVAAPDGKSVSVSLTIAADAPVSMRQVVVMSSGGTAYPVAQPNADRILVTQPMPEVQSIEPLYGTPGTSSFNLVIRGRNLHSAQSLNFAPADGITVGSTLTANAEGTQLIALLAISPSATVGPRVVTVTTPAGTSDATASSSNVFTIANQVVGNVTPIAAPLLGVVKQDSTPAPQQSMPLFAKALGITLGSAATSISPQAKAVGDSFTLTVQGVGLQGVTAVNFVPNTGITVAAPVIAPDGLSLTVEVSIAADAPQTVRALQLLVGSTRLEFAKPAAAAFTVTAPQPVINSTEPQAIQLGASQVVMTIRGQNFQNAQSVRFVPPEGITVGTPTVNGSATELTVSVSAAGNAAPGPRAVVVTTPGGETSTSLSVANTVSFGSTISTTGLVAPLLGIVKQNSTTPEPTSYGPIAAANLGVVFGDSPSEPAISSFMAAKPLGVSLGAVATSIQPKVMPVSTSAALTINGIALEGATGISFNPPQGITVDGPLQVSDDGTQVTVPISIAANAEKTLRQVTVNSAAGKISFANQAASALQITSDMQPQLSSISPILSTAGSLLTLTVRGQNLQGAIAVIATPATGLIFDSQPTVNNDGTELTVRLKIASDAPLISRVIQVVTPAFTSSPDASPANTFTVYAP